MRLSKTVQVHSILKIPKGFHNFPKSTTKLYIEEAQEAAGEKGQKNSCLTNCVQPVTQHEEPLRVKYVIIYRKRSDV